MAQNSQIFGVIFAAIVLLFVTVFGADKKPNIIVIIADDLGWNDVSFHGADQIPTPNIDALAYNGIILNSHYSQALCTPSRAAFLTGKYPIHLGLQHLVILEPEPRGLPLKEKLMPEYLREAGYSTHAIGKWHLGFYKHEYTPLYRGFDSHFGYWNGLQDYYKHDVYATFNDSIHGYDMRRNMEVAYDAEGKYSTTLFTDEAVKLIKEHNDNKPMFMYLAHLAAHSGNRFDPLQAPDEEIAKFAHIPDPHRRVYAAMVSLLDDSVGKVVTALREKHMLENSIIVFISDNGAQPWGTHQNHGSNYPLRGMKVSPWEGGNRVPAVIWSPLLKNRQYVSNQMMHISDWMPTLFSAAGISQKNLDDIDGINLWEEISRGGKSSRSELLYNIDDTFNYSAIRRGDWKYLLGTVGEGKLDEWYGDSGSGPQYSYSPETVLKSHAGVALTGFVTDQQIKEKDEHGNNAKNIEFSHKLLTQEKIWELRNKSTIICKKLADVTSNHKCNPLESPCLFNILEDPCEQINLASERPVIVQNLENAIAQFRKSIIPSSNAPMDLRADPSLWNQTWVPWQDCDIMKKKVESPMTPTSYAILGVLCVLFFIVVMILIAISCKTNNKKKNQMNEDSFDLDTSIGVIHIVSDDIGDKGESFQNHEAERRASMRDDSKNIH